MTALNKYAELREELSNPANGSNHHLRKLALSLLDDLETKEAQRANWFQMAHKLGEDLDVAEKRIAELEARDEPKFVKCWSCKHDIEVLAIVECDGYCPRCAAPIDLDDEPYAGIGAKGELQGGKCE
ncbi:TPA: hypothetical protein ACRZFR_000277 [Escherichia coli]